ncbi:uncharacterized protein LOC126631878 [Malus sylvestris]|uniref:uncharacterized protein LOC126631878 n=1 Tax=Malus sylvestris TaxID=3752 RepID=UPI0010AAD2BE|nr:uncharacterized protein LOC114826615 [Malus domestica]XP_050158030.1 uncharacterized protein LOC126631878 [Malus sylvestris]
MNAYPGGYTGTTCAGCTLRTKSTQRRAHPCSANPCELRDFPVISDRSTTKGSGHYAAWGEDLVLVVMPGEIIPSYGLRDMEQALGRELVISGHGRRDHDAGIGLGVIFIQ